MGRAPCCDKANVKKGPWSPEEDSKLKDYIDKYGTGGNWIALPKKAGLKRCGKSCRLRWLNYLRPNIKHGEFSDEEDRIICSLFANIGSRWSIIAAQLPGRTDNDIKNYWNTKLKKKLTGMHMAPPPPPPLSHRNLLRPPPCPPSSSHQIRPFVYDKSFSSGFELLPPHVSMAFNHYFSNPTTNSTLYPTQNASPYAFAFDKPNNNLLMFGSIEGNCSTSSDGSSNQTKKEKIGFDQSFNQSSNISIDCFDNDQDQKNQGFMMVNYGDNSAHQMLDQWSERGPNGFCFGADNTLEFSDHLEDVKQLSIKSNNSMLFNGDERKTEEKVMYFYR